MVLRHDHALGGFDADGALVGQLLLGDELHETAGAIAALFHFAAVVVEDAVAEVVCAVVRGFHQQQLVEANAQVTVTKLAQSLRREAYRLADAIHHHKVVAEAVHFAELEFHGRYACEVRQSKRPS
ncbi:hypothetical protein D3C72_1609680 [compost metagenome]